jgi:hypothetical protein
MESVLYIVIAFVAAYIITFLSKGKTLESSIKENSISKQDNVSLIIPEESTLKRHFFSLLRTNIESELAPRPTCSTLKRHHEALIETEVGKRLQEAA